jgi:hypothetical protein
MKREQFVETFLEGSKLTAVDRDTLVNNLVGMVFDLRKTVSSQKEHIAYMDDIARGSVMMNCRSCGKSYEPDCELSEMSHESNFCGGSERCCP